LKEFIPEAEVIRSDDGDYKRCGFLYDIEINNMKYEKGTRRCFFAPMVGF